MKRQGLMANGKFAKLKQASHNNMKPKISFHCSKPRKGGIRPSHGDCTVMGCICPCGHGNGGVMVEEVSRIARPVAKRLKEPAGFQGSRDPAITKLAHRWEGDIKKRNDQRLCVKCRKPKFVVEGYPCE